MPERAEQRSASREVEAAMSTQCQYQNTHRAASRALNAYSRAVVLAGRA